MWTGSQLFLELLLDFSAVLCYTVINGILTESEVQTMFGKKEPPIGIGDFKVLIDNNYYAE